MHITSIEGNKQWLDGGAMFGHAPRAMWQKWVSVNDAHCIPLHCRSLLARIADKTFLFEVGVGDYMEEKLQRRFGIEGGGAKLMSGLDKLDVQEDDIDYVVLSHLHFDHAGGLVPSWPALDNDDWQPRFAKAKYVVSRKQYEHSLHPHARDRASYIPGLSERLESSGRLILIDDEQETLEGFENHIEFIHASGHTPGLLHALIKGDEERIYFCSDMIPGTPWLNLPIVTGYDRFPEKTVDEKGEVLARAEKENWWLFYTHDENHAASRLKKDPRGRYTFTDPQESLDHFELK